ncbi:MAG: alpha/beta hydrolase [Ignavibacteriales bacterium]|nr:alpha/beta hydrolase [Ignavibacteriales bacterium]
MIKKNQLNFFILFFLLLGFVNNSLSQQQNILSKDETRIIFHAAGNGEPALVFVHGWSCDKSYWNDQVKTFSPKYKVVTIDLAGHGESGMNRKNYTMESFGEDITAVINKLGLKKVILIGHSMGGYVIIEAARQLKEKIIGLVGADTYQGMEDEMTKEQIDQFMKPFKEKFVQKTKEFVKTMFPKTADSTLVNRVADDMSSAPPRVAISAMQNLFSYHAFKALKDMNAPIISINCDRYPLNVEETRKHTKSFEVKMMNGVGHFVMLEDPQKFNKLLQESIDELVRTK